MLPTNNGAFLASYSREQLIIHARTYINESQMSLKQKRVKTLLETLVPEDWFDALNFGSLELGTDWAAPGVDAIMLQVQARFMTVFEEWFETVEIVGSGDIIRYSLWKDLKAAVRPPELPTELFQIFDQLDAASAMELYCNARNSRTLETTLRRLVKQGRIVLSEK